MSHLVGTVRWFNNAKGYGFLGSAEGPDIFVHFTAIEQDGYRSLKEGDAVEFSVIPGPTGRPQASNVRRLKPESKPTTATVQA